MSRTQKLIFAGLLLVGFVFMSLLPAQAKHNQIKPEDQLVTGPPLPPLFRKHVLEDNFVLVKTVRAMPKVVQASIMSGGIRNGMADAGQPYEISDMVGPKPLPFRRLIFAAVSPEYCLVYNEYGGYGTGQELVLYRLSSGQATITWRAALRHNAQYLTFTEIRDAIQATKSAK